jgi:peptide/nickel transport system substrate-binding protein
MQPANHGTGTTRQRPGQPGRRLAALAATAALAAFAGGPMAFGQTAAGAPSPRAAEKKIVLIARQDPGTLDYVKSNLTALRLWVPANVVEPLVYFDKTGTAAPGVAASWLISDDKLAYTFNLRPAKFSNGAPVTADDVVFSLTAMSKSPVVPNAAVFSAVKSVEKLDDHTVKVTLSRPSQIFWHGMGDMAGLVQPQASASGIATAPIGTGPYKLAEYVANSAMHFVANPLYWGTAAPVADVTVRIIPDGTAALNALDAGEADGFPAIAIDLWEQLGKRGLDKKFSLVTYPQMGEPTYAVLNARLDPKLRQTIAATFDRQSFNEAFGASWGAENTCTFALPNQPWYQPANAASCPYPYDLAAATKAVAAGGYAKQKLNLASLSNVPDLSLPADVMIAEMQAAGLNVERNPMDLARFAQLIFQGRPPQFDVTVMSGAANPSLFACPDPAKAGWTTYCSADYTQALAKADQAITNAGYLAAMADAAAILRKDAVIVPLLAKQGVGLFHPALLGFTEPRVSVGIEFAPLHW